MNWSVLKVVFVLTFAAMHIVQAPSKSWGGTENCVGDDLSSLHRRDLPRLEKIHRDDYDSSAEGGAIDYYYDEGRISAIEATYFGETGKLALKVYLASQASYQIDLREQKYSQPIRQLGWKVISDKAYTFYVCNGVVMQFWGDSDYLKSYDKAREILEILLAKAPIKTK